MIVDELIAILGFKVQGEAEAKRFQSRIASLDKGLANFAARATSAGAMFRTAMTGIAAAFTGGIIANFGKSVIQTAGQFEKFESMLLTGFKGNEQAAKDALDWIEKFAARTPYALDGVTDAFIKLKNYGIDPIANDSLRILGDTASAMGKPLMQVVEAVADATRENFVRLEELGTGLNAAKVSEGIEFTWTRAGVKNKQLVKKDAVEIQKFIQGFWDKEFGGGMIRMSKTWEGLFSNLGDVWTRFKRKIATSGGDNSLFQNVKNRLADLLEWVDEMDAAGKLNEWAGNIGKAYNKAFNIMLQQAKHVQTLAKYWNNVKGALSAVGGGFLLLAARAHPLIAAISGLGLVLEDYLVYKEGGRSVIGRVIASITDKGKAITKEDIAKRIGELLITIPVKYIFGDPKPDKEKTEGFWKRTAKSIEKDLEDIDKTGKELGKFLSGKPSEDSFLKTIQGFLQGIDTGIDKGGGKKFNDWFRNTNKSIDEWFKNLSKINEKSGKALLSIFAFTKDTQKTFEDMQKFIESIDWQGTGAKIINGIWNGMMAPFSGLKKWWEGSFNSLPNVSGNYRSNMPGASNGAGGIPSNYRDSMEPELPMWEDPDTKAMDNLFRNIDKQKRTNEDPYEGARTYYDHQTINRAAPTVQINQTITKATDAPQRAAEATGKAVSNVFSTQSPSRLELEPALP